MATYNFTYNLITHSHQMHSGKRVVTMAEVQVSCTRTNDDSSTDSCTFNTSVNWSLDSATKVVPRREPDGSALQDRTDHTDYSSLTIPDDVITWVREYFENDAVRLDGFKSLADHYIGE